MASNFSKIVAQTEIKEDLNFQLKKLKEKIFASSLRPLPCSINFCFAYLITEIYYQNQVHPSEHQQ